MTHRRGEGSLRHYDNGELLEIDSLMLDPLPFVVSLVHKAF